MKELWQIVLLLVEYLFSFNRAHVKQLANLENRVEGCRWQKWAASMAAYAASLKGGGPWTQNMADSSGSFGAAADGSC